MADDKKKTAETSRLRKAWRITRAGYLAAGFSALVATTLYVVPTDYMPAMQPGMEEAINNYKIALSEFLLSGNNKAPAPQQPAPQPGQ